jgi:hypothetical protein
MNTSILAELRPKRVLMTPRTPLPIVAPRAGSVLSVSDATRLWSPSASNRFDVTPRTRATRVWAAIEEIDNEPRRPREPPERILRPAATSESVDPSRV